MKQQCFVIRRNSNDLTHWKYIKKVRGKNGKWRYYYDKDALKSDIKRKAESTLTDAKKKFDSVYNDPTNIYDTDASTYDEKMKQIANSKEWQDIVRRQDPEYVRRNADGSTTYLIDDYLLKKKHPELDAIYDIAYGREISFNKMDKKALIAGGKDYIKAAQKLLKISATALMKKHNFVQGSYDDDITNAVNRAKTEVERYNNLSRSTIDAANTLTDTVKTVSTGMEYVNKVQKVYDRYSNSRVDNT